MSLSAHVQIDDEPIVIQSDIDPPMGVMLTWVGPSCTAFNTPVALTFSIVVVAEPGLGVVENDSPELWSLDLGVKLLGLVPPYR